MVTVDQLDLQGVEEGLHSGVVVTAGPPAQPIGRSRERTFEARFLSSSLTCSTWTSRAFLPTHEAHRYRCTSKAGYQARGERLPEEDSHLLENRGLARPHLKYPAPSPARGYGGELPPTPPRRSCRCQSRQTSLPLSAGTAATTGTAWSDGHRVHRQPARSQRPREGPLNGLLFEFLGVLTAGLGTLKSEIVVHGVTTCLRAWLAYGVVH